MCGGEQDGIQSIIENEGADQWVRGAALSSLVTLVAAGQKTREEIVSYFARLLRGKLARKWSHVWDALVDSVCDIYPAELMDDIEQAYEEGLVDPRFIGFDDVKRDLAMGESRVLARLAGNSNRRLVEDTANEMEWWSCFREDEARRANAPISLSPQSQTKREKTKIGRNEPCQCGSGKKYKKCCGA